MEAWPIFRSAAFARPAPQLKAERAAVSFRQTGESLRGGMTFHGFEIVYPGKRLRLTHIHLSRRKIGAVPDCTGGVEFK